MLSKHFSHACEIQLYVAENGIVSIDYFIENIISKMETTNKNYNKKNFLMKNIIMKNIKLF